MFLREVSLKEKLETGGKTLSEPAASNSPLSYYTYSSNMMNWGGGGYKTNVDRIMEVTS